MPSGLARWLGCALIALATSCDPFSYGESAQRAIIGDGGDGGATVDDTLVVPDIMIEGPDDALMEPDALPDADAMPDAMIVPDAMIDAMPDAMIDAMADAMVDAMIDAPPPDSAVPDAGVPDASVPPDGAPPGDGGPGDGSLSDALNPDAREPPGLPVGGSHDDQIKSFYACSTGDGASALPLLLAILVLRRRRR